MAFQPGGNDEMKIINHGGGIVLMDLDDFNGWFADLQWMKHYRPTVVNDVAIIGWDSFERMLDYLTIAELMGLAKEQGVTCDWGNKVLKESEAKRFIADRLFTELKEGT
jgi:hypothetical protein